MAINIACTRIAKRDDHVVVIPTDKALRPVRRHKAEFLALGPGFDAVEVDLLYCEL